MISSGQIQCPPRYLRVLRQDFRRSQAFGPWVLYATHDDTLHQFWSAVLKGSLQGDVLLMLHFLHVFLTFHVSLFLMYFSSMKVMIVEWRCRRLLWLLLLIIFLPLRIQCFQAGHWPFLLWSCLTCFLIDAEMDE